MADISQELAAILAAVYGEQVRSSIHDAIDKINKVGEKVMTVGTAVTGPTSSSEGFFTASLYLNSDTMELWKCTGTNAWASQGILKGEDGEPGTGITSIEKTGTVGLVDTYTITYDDGTTSDFEVTNGADGENGNAWYRGTAISGKSVNPTVFSSSGITEAHINDFYLNTTEGAIYHCALGGAPAVATWVYDFTLTGGGGGGGTDNYNDLENKPQIGGVTLQGNKSASDLGLYTKTEVDSALADKVDKDGSKVLSDNNYSNADKAIVDGVTSALAGKADSATTLEGYGITDAYTKTEVDTALAGKANTSQLDEWTAEQTLGAGNTVTFSGLNDNLAYDLYCDAVGAGIQSVTKSGTSLTYVLTGSGLLVGTTKCKLRIVK